MRKILFSIGTLIFVENLKAQLTQLSNTDNYIQTKVYLDYNLAGQPIKSSETVQYIDGLGRVKQLVNIKASPLGRDVVTPIIYDSFGRQTRDYLPVPQSGTQNGIYAQGTLVDFPVGDPQAVYLNEKPFSERTLENSPLERVQQHVQEGKDWENKPVKFKYSINETGEVRKLFTTTSVVNNATKSTIEDGGTYQAGQLYKNIIIDEDGNQLIEFKNGKGQVVLLRKIVSATQNADTYYVYNEYDQLAWVIPPLLAKMQSWGLAEQNALAYEYRYDGRNRLVEKKVPGKGWEYLVYDKKDRIVLIQDAMLGSNDNSFGRKGWLFTKYDQFDRVIYTGFFGNTATRSAMQTAINNMTANPGNSETRSTTPFNVNGMDIYYSKNAFPTGSMTVLSINYYDTYPPLPSTVTVPSFIINTEQTILSDKIGKQTTKGLPVASYVKNIDNDQWTKNYNWYDQKGRMVGTHSINSLGGETRMESLLDFSGVIKLSNTYHKRTVTDTEIVIKEIFDYDHQNRLISHKHKVNDNFEEPLSINTYDELGRLINKKVGKNDDDGVLQSIEYRYNIRGWLTSINDPSALNGRIFGMKIKYQSPEDPNYSKARYNGNISEIDWKTSVGDKIYRRYSYKYDSLNRLTEGIYLTPELASNTHNHFYDEKISYDLNGNIETLDRFKNPPPGQNTPMQIDELVYDYEISEGSNKLIKVTDNNMNPSGYPAGGNTIEYDQNGNMINLLDKNIKSITYNYLNLPIRINATVGGLKPGTSEGMVHSYNYRADGTKYGKRVDNINQFGNEFTETDYIDGFLYERKYSKLNTDQNGYDSGFSLSFFPTSEGFYNFTRKEYVYNFKDHLGNVRYSYKAADGGGIFLMEESNYYPFGLQHQGYNDGGKIPNNSGGYLNYQYKYNGKELQETGMYDYGARMYMPELGRWGVIDPLVEKTNDPYGYVWNNPVGFVDPTGMQGKNDYKLNQDGSVTLIRPTNKRSDTLFATDKKGNVDLNKSVTVKKKEVSDSTIISQLQFDANRGGGELLASLRVGEGDVSIGQTTNVNDAVGVFNFMNANTKSNIEIALFKYDKGKGVNYLLATQHSFDTLTKAFDTAMKKYIGDTNNLIGFIHNHDGYNGSHPDEIGNQWGDDQNTRKTTYTSVLKNSNMLPRFMTVHEGLGNTLIELHRSGHTKTNMQLTPATLKSLNKIHYDNAQ